MIETHKYTRPVSELDAAQRYYFYGETPVIGRSKFDVDLLKRIKMPELPLLASNREQRMSLQNSGVFARLRGFAKRSYVAFETSVLSAIEQENQKLKGFRTFNIKDALQDPLPGENDLNIEPMTIDEFKQLCSN